MNVTQRRVIHSGRLENSRRNNHGQPERKRETEIFVLRFETSDANATLDAPVALLLSMHSLHWGAVNHPCVFFHGRSLCSVSLVCSASYLRFHAPIQQRFVTDTPFREREVHHHESLTSNFFRLQGVTAVFIHAFRLGLKHLHVAFANNWRMLYKRLGMMCEKII